MKYHDLSKCVTDEQMIRVVRQRFPHCPNPHHYPKTFEYYYKLYIYYKHRQERHGII